MPHYSNSDDHTEFCTTEVSKPKAYADIEVIVGERDGYIPLWQENTVLNWKFSAEISALDHRKATIANLLEKALALWGDAAPVQFRQSHYDWDLEIVISRYDRLNSEGRRVRADGFFPSETKNKLKFYPHFFGLTAAEQERIVLHELGHIFGLRHYFAGEAESDLPSHLFGEHRKFTIMNYGEFQKFSDADKRDLKRLYDLAWKGELTEIGGTPIELLAPFSTES